MTAPILEARSLRKTYGQGGRRIEIFQGVGLVLQAGESVSISGVSGSGKSTLLQLLAGLEHADDGEVWWEGRPITTASAGDLAGRRTRFLGMVFQSFLLVPELNALENVLLAARIAGPVDRTVRGRATALLEQLGLADRATHGTQQLSGGECQRVAMARALMNSPRLVLADEPTGNLDELTGAVVVDQLLGLCRDTGAALILVTHNPAHAAKTTRRFTLHDGRLH